METKFEQLLRSEIMTIIAQRLSSKFGFRHFWGQRIYRISGYNQVLLVHLHVSHTILETCIRTYLSVSAPKSVHFYIRINYLQHIAGKGDYANILTNEQIQKQKQMIS